MLRAAGRKRYLDSTAATIHAALQTEHLPARPLLTWAFGASARALVAIISELSTQIASLAIEVKANFGRYPDAAMRARGIAHNDALRQLANRLVGIPHGCLRHRTHYNETTTWPPPQQDQ